MQAEPHDHWLSTQASGREDRQREPVWQREYRAGGDLTPTLVGQPVEGRAHVRYKTVQGILQLQPGLAPDFPIQSETKQEGDLTGNGPAAALRNLQLTRKEQLEVKPMKLFGLEGQPGGDRAAG